MTPEPPDQEAAGEQTGELSDELASLSAAGDEPQADPWPQYEGAAVAGPVGRAPDRTAPGIPGQELEEEPAGLGLSPFATVLLLAALVVVTFGGILVGRAVQPSSTAATTVTTTPVAVTTAPKPKPVAHEPRPAITRFGPLRVTVIGHFTPAVRASAAIVGSKLVVAGGVGSARVLAGPVAGRLAQIGTLSSGRADPAVFALGGSVYILGGEQGKLPTDQVVRIDPRTGRSSSAGTFEEPLAEAAAAVKAGVVYIVGGWTGQKYATAVLRYTPGAAPTLVARLPQGLRAPAVAIVGNTLLVAGGLTQQGLSRQIYGVDLASGGVKALGALPQGLERGTLLHAAAKLYLIGGSTATGSPLTGVVSIDPATGRAEPVGTLPKPMSGAVAVRDGAGALLVDPADGLVYRVG